MALIMFNAIKFRTSRTFPLCHPSFIDYFPCTSSSVRSCVIPLSNLNCVILHWWVLLTKYVINVLILLHLHFHPCHVIKRTMPIAQLSINKPPAPLVFTFTAISVRPNRTFAEPWAEPWAEPFGSVRFGGDTEVRPNLFLKKTEDLSVSKRELSY